jgi:predicted acetyltransferase
MKSTFMEDPKLDFTEAQQAWWASIWDSERIRGGYADGRWVATLRTFPTVLTVPDGARGTAEIAADALTQVTVAATHRRQGLLRGMLTASLEDAKERGEVVSILRAAEWTIYGRYGYWPSTLGCDYQVVLAGNGAAIERPAGFDVRQIDPAEVIKYQSDVYDRMRVRRAGHIQRTDAMRRRALGLDGLKSRYGREPICVIATAANGQVDGTLWWMAKDGNFFDGKLDIEVLDLTAATDDAYQALWHYVLNIDLSATAGYRERAVDEQLEWLLTDGRIARRQRTWDDVWLRMLDVPAALSARRYAATDRLVLDVVDSDTGGYGQGRVTLDGGPDDAECTATPTATADLRLSQRALAAVYLGGHSLTSQVWAGYVDEESPGALDRFAVMLRTDQPPWNATGF